MRGRYRGLLCTVLVGLACVASAWATQPTWAARPGQAAPAALNSGFSPQVSGTSRTLRAIACPRVTICYTVGDQGTIVATTNGGRIWRVQNNPLRGLSDLNAITCPAPTTCYIAGGYTVAKAGPDGWTPPAEGAILATTNGGRTWTAQRSHRGYTLLYGVACVSARTCLIAGDQGTTVATTNGGRTWLPQSGATSHELYGIACSTARTCYAVGVTGAAEATADLGASWTTGTSGSLFDLRGVACVAATTCVAVGANGTIVRTTDGGQTYNAAATPFDAVYVKPSFYSVACPTAHVCYAAGLGAVAASANGGVTWSALTSNTASILNGLACPSATVCYAVGTQGSILKTTAIRPGAGAPAAAPTATRTGSLGGTGTGTGASAVTVDHLLVATPSQDDAAILHPTDTATVRVWYHSTPGGPAGITGRLTILENGASVGSYALRPTAAPDGTPIFAATVKMATLKPGLLTLQCTLQAATVVSTKSMLITLLYD